jgi:hypothetical protein
MFGIHINTRNMSLDTISRSDSEFEHAVRCGFSSFDELLAYRHSQRHSHSISLMGEKIHSPFTIYDKSRDGTEVQFAPIDAGVDMSGEGRYESRSRFRGHADCVQAVYTSTYYGKDFAADNHRLRVSLAECFAKDKTALLSLVMDSFGKRRPSDEEDHHSVYMLSLVWLWELHPAEFMAVAPKIEYEDLLPLLSVITFNRSFSLERLWEGFKYGTSREANRIGMIAEEKELWKDLLMLYSVTSNDVVRTQNRPSRTRFHPSSTPASAVTKSATGGTRGTSKNVWLHEEFKVNWQIARAKLHRRDYADRTGVGGTSENYNALVDFVVSSFVKGLTASDPRALACAPAPGGSYDECTKGLRAFHEVEAIPLSWGRSHGISHAIAYKMFGHLLESRTDSDNAVSAKSDRTFLMRLYKQTVK